MPSTSPGQPGAGLAGVRVVDFGHQIAGPLAALLLAEAGADVVHVDSPRSAGSPGPTDAFFNRSKRRITLDLRGAADRATARDLVARADVVVENFRPGVMDRLGLGPAAARDLNERLVYCSLPGFASDDEKAGLAGWEGVIQTAVAGYRPLREHWDPSGRNKATVQDPAAPLFTPITTASNFGGLMGAVSVVMALIARERTGRGQRVEVPLAEAYAEAYSTMLGMRVYENPLMGDNHMLRDLTYTCADGGMIDLSPYSKFVIPLLVAAGVAPEWERLGLIDVAARTFSRAKRDTAMAMFTELVRSHPATWWDEVAAKAEMPVSMVRTPAQWVATEHAAESGAVVTLDDPLAGPIVLPGRGFDLAAVPAPRPRHLPDQDRAAILAELGAIPAGPTPLGGPAVGAIDLPLEGYQAIDVSQAVAGPTAARLLADFGADVIKVGNTVPAVTDGIVGQLHRGKRTILLDAKSEAGGRLAGDLIRAADVLVTNFTPKSQARYGIDYDRASRLNPGLVYCSITAYGLTGPWAHRRGYENQCNAATGMSWRYGSRFGWTLYQPTPINDADTGILGAYAVAVGLFARLRGGGGQKVGASLAQGSTLHQAAYLTAEAQVTDRDLRDGEVRDGDVRDGGPDRLRNEYGAHALYRFYATKDRWIFLAARREELVALLRATGLEGSQSDYSWRNPGGVLAEMLASRFADEPADHWVALLTEAGIAVQILVPIDDAVAYLHRRGVVYFERGLDGEDVARPGIGRWLSETPPRVGASPGAVGSQAVEILAELGVTEPEMKTLASENVICLPDALPQLQRLT
ncbi:CaiB/BaiF CoA-transferase family protein [Pseudofrankia inefficax]|uniref:L-carnitine dehydratase/bile acid-inducible protein F n=1 Tax=Pseudofrankia inefficax (strain DSM 45817 / CECT 9037 / DDB 130130 / EuI1c) TaxID=298654 RepID=E3J898_PSEI1|nr:CoA transferase [Pseudofrankia inefficax]ADP83291.1 L-carnitine dehydratase/bile acid-inducible protein F [Pseudofrankia inefficax]